MKTAPGTRSAPVPTIPIRLVRGPVPVGDGDLIHIIATWTDGGPWITVCARAIPMKTASTWDGGKNDATCDLCRRWTTR